jgi:hypothetical protein
MKLCNNCGVQLSCGCQRRTASDNTSCCEACITEYEAKLNPPKPAPQPTKPVEKKVEVEAIEFDVIQIDDKS